MSPSSIHFRGGKVCTRIRRSEKANLMEFRPIAVDLEPGLSNPVVAISFAICCAIFAGALVTIARSGRTQPGKVRRVVATLVVGSIGSDLLPQMMNGLVARVHFLRLGQHPSIGLIGEPASFWLAPSVATAVAILVLGMIAFWHRGRAA